MEEKVVKEKNSKVGVIIAIIITLVVVVVAAVGGYFIHEKKEFEKPIEQDWGQAYYTFIKEKINEPKNENEEHATSFNQENIKIEFCDVENIEKPIMVFQYVEDEKEFTNVLYLCEDNSVSYTHRFAPSTVEYLYDIENKKYDWYLHYEGEDEDGYENISEQINYYMATKNLQGEELTQYNYEHEMPAELTFKKDDKRSVTKQDGTELEITKFDEKFIKTDVAEENLVDFDTKSDKKEIKKTFEQVANNFKTEENLVTEEVKEEVAQKESEVVAKQEEIKQTEEENARIAEEKRKQEELAKGLQVGNHRLKYGTYKLEYDMGGFYGTIKLEPDGKCHINSNGDIDSLKKEVFNQDTTYTVETHVELEMPGIYSDCIVFRMNGKKIYFEVFKENAFSDQWHGYVYRGE